jgi:putative transposase
MCAFIREHEGEFEVVTMCRVLEISTSGYYDWRSRSLSQSTLRRMVPDEGIADVFHAHKGRAGSPRVWRELVALGFDIGEDFVAERMRAQGLRAKAKRKFKATTNSNHDLPVSPDLLQRDFSADAPNRKWVGDITYLQTTEGWRYLAVFIDLYSRRVVGWSVGERMTADLACNALRMAWFRGKRPVDVIVHTDRGSKHCSRAFRELGERFKAKQSMSRKGDCWDNAVAEFFFHTLKVEALSDGSLASRAHTRAMVFNYIEAYYNRQRLHSSIGYMTPEAFERRAAV